MFVLKLLLCCDSQHRVMSQCVHTAHSCVRQHCKLIWRQLKFRRDIRFSGIFWDLAPCSMVGSDRRFRDAYCLHHEGNVLFENHQQLVSDVRWSSGLCTQKAEGCVLMARYSWSVFLDLFNGALSTALFKLLQLQAHSWTAKPETCNTDYFLHLTEHFAGLHLDVICGEALFCVNWRESRSFECDRLTSKTTDLD
jgi:hypothetical protein